MTDGPSESARRGIVRVEPQKRNPDRVNVYLDDAYAFSLSRIVAEAVGLHSGQRLDDDAPAELLRRQTFQDALDRAFGFLAHRPRSVHEVRQRLSQKGVAPEVIEAVVERLGQLGLVDDEAFARYWTANRERFNPRGAMALRAELRRKGVASDVAAVAVEAIDEEGGAEAIARRRLPRLRGLDFATFRQRLGAYLVRRGFSYEVAGPVIQRLWREIAAEAGTASDERGVRAD